jgi:predicted dehydrogenase
MTLWPEVNYGHTGLDAAFVRRDVYGIAPQKDRTRKQRLKVAIVGAGGVARAKWIPALRRLQSVGEPVDACGVADPRAETREAAASAAGSEGYESFDALLKKVHPDLTLVLTTDAAHVEVARQAVDHNVPALVEKPLSPDYFEARDLALAARSRKVLLAAVANKRFSPPYALAKKLIGAGALKGLPTLFSGKFTLGYPYVDLLEGGAVHLLDLMAWFMGPAARLHARGVRDRNGELLSAVISASFASGAIGSLVTSSAGLSFKPWERVEVFGHNAFVLVDDQFETTLFDEETGPAKSWRPSIPNTLMFDEEFGGYVGQLENVFDAVRGLAPLVSSGLDGAAAVGLIEATRRSIETGAEIDIAQEGLAP